MEENKRLWVEYDNPCVDSYISRTMGDWSRDHEFTLKNVSLSKPEYNYGAVDFTVDFDVKPGDEVFVLYVIYSSGDSFGLSDGEAEIIWVFKDPELAFRAKHQYEKNRKEYKISIMTDSGKTLELSNPGWGYFESIDYAEVESRRVNV